MSVKVVEYDEHLFFLLLSLPILLCISHAFCPYRLKSSLNLHPDQRLETEFNLGKLDTLDLLDTPWVEWQRDEKWCQYPQRAHDWPGHRLITLDPLLHERGGNLKHDDWHLFWIWICLPALLCFCQQKPFIVLLNGLFTIMMSHKMLLLFKELHLQEKRSNAAH